MGKTAPCPACRPSPPAGGSSVVAHPQAHGHWLSGGELASPTASSGVVAPWLPVGFGPREAPRGDAVGGGRGAPARGPLLGAPLSRSSASAPSLCPSRPACGRAFLLLLPREASRSHPVPRSLLRPLRIGPSFHSHESPLCRWPCFLLGAWVMELLLLSLLV